VPGAEVPTVSAGRPKVGLPWLMWFGPAFVAAVAYIDPGNFATNIEGGARFGYALLWVVVASNLIAMLVQILAAKLGLATGRNLAELCREFLPGPLVWLMWGLWNLWRWPPILPNFSGPRSVSNFCSECRFSRRPCSPPL